MNGEATVSAEPVELLAIGTVIEVTGSQMIAELSPQVTELSRVYNGEVYDIGQFGSIVKVHFGNKAIYAMVRKLRMKAEYEAEHGMVSEVAADERVLEADLVGEGEYRRPSDRDKGAEVVFERGVSTYPLPQQTVYLTPKPELRAIHQGGTGESIQLGEHVGGDGIPCSVDANELLGKHTAILGTTGTGKSATVAALLHSIVEGSYGTRKGKWNPRIVILDPHNEYGAAFPQGKVVSPDDLSLKLPYWLLNVQEMMDLVIGRTEFVATSQANIVKDALLKARKLGAEELGMEADAISVDSPMPFRLRDFRELIDADKPPQASKQDSHNSILEKLRVLSEDRRMRFMMEDWRSGDDAGNPLSLLMGELVRSEVAPVIVDLSGIPHEVAGIVTGTIARMVFNWKVWQTVDERKKGPVLFVCEEAHLYVPNREEAQYVGAQNAVRRLVREGRKYGIGVMVISQRPSEVDITVLSQCSSWIVLRMGNEVDRQHVRAALPDAMEGFVEALPSLKRREALILGQAVELPARMRVRELPSHLLPRSQDVDFFGGWRNALEDDDSLEAVATRWQYQGAVSDGE